MLRILKSITRTFKMLLLRVQALFVCLFGFLTSSSTTRLYRRRAPRQERLTILRAATHETELETMTSVSAGHIIQTPTTCSGC